MSLGHALPRGPGVRSKVTRRKFPKQMCVIDYLDITALFLCFCIQNLMAICYILELLSL